VSLIWLGDYQGWDHNMGGTRNADAVFVAAPAWHDFMVQALKGVPDKWYNPPGNIQQLSDGTWVLKSTPKVDHLPNDSPSPSPSASNDPNAGGGGGGNPNLGPQPVGGGPRPTPGGGNPTPTPVPIFGGGGGGGGG
jgi:hypothetical protein